MGILWTIVLGFVIGVLAKILHPGKENMGFIATVVLGIAGSSVLGPGIDLGAPVKLAESGWTAIDGRYTPPA